MKSISKAFSFVEIIITISIISLLAIIWISSKQRYDENVNNSKIVSDVETINNALISFSEEIKNLPMPGWNTNFYSSDTSYKHSYEDPNTFWVYGSLTENIIPKKYLDILPLDPRTNSYYAYGKTKLTNEFEVASVQYIDAQPITKVTWNYTAENGPYNLIREYNWPNFVYDKSKANFPYNPDELVLIASVKESWEWKNYREWDIISTWAWEEKEIFFSDWSVSILEENSQITLNKLNFKWKDNLNSFVKIALWAGTIWTRATKLNDESSFEVYTTDTNAAVRWTIFKVTLNPWNTEVIVVEWIVDLNYNWTKGKIEVNKWESPEKGLVNNGMLRIQETIWVDVIIPQFSENSDLRDTETVINTCPTFIIPWEWCVLDTSPELTASWYKLVAYAPYNTLNDYNLYTNTSNISATVANLDHAGDDSQSLDVGDVDNNSENILNISKLDWSNHNFYYINSSKTEVWIFMDNVYATDKLMYDISNLNLWSNFAIEMSVLGSAFKNVTGTYYLYEVWDIYLKISWWYLKMWFMHTVTDETNKQVINSSQFSNLDSNTFYKVIAIYDWNNRKLQLNDLEPTTFGNPHNITSINNIYIWSNKNTSNQLNNIIDYVKIYKKN